MAAVLDTLRFPQRLQHSGVSREQAEAHAEVARDMIVVDLVTKTDLHNELGRTKSELQSDLALTRNDLRSEPTTLRAEVSAAIREAELRMTTKLGAMMAAAAGVVVTSVNLP